MNARARMLRAAAKHRQVVVANTAGAIGARAVPACPICGVPTARQDLTHRVCPAGHRSAVVTTAEAWQAVPA